MRFDTVTSSKRTAPEDAAKSLTHELNAARVKDVFSVDIFYDKLTNTYMAVAVVRIS